MQRKEGDAKMNEKRKVPPRYRGEVESPRARTKVKAS